MRREKILIQVATKWLDPLRSLHGKMRCTNVSSRRTPPCSWFQIPSIVVIIFLLVDDEMQCSPLGIWSNWKPILYRRRDRVKYSGHLPTPSNSPLWSFISNVQIYIRPLLFSKKKKDSFQLDRFALGRPTAAAAVSVYNVKTRSSSSSVCRWSPRKPLPPATAVGGNKTRGG